MDNRATFGIKQNLSAYKAPSTSHQGSVKHAICSKVMPLLLANGRDTDG